MLIAALSTLQVLRSWREEANAAGERSSGRHSNRLIDVAVLGLGLNCHLGFNEPRSDWPCWLSADEVWAAPRKR